MKLSVFLLTYNHERFIRQALQGVLMQRTCFDYEILVGEDASTDGTARVIREVQAANPNRIRANLRERNVGMNRNFMETYHSCQGDYVAYLDGDDYWTCPDKLQKQIDYLDQHPSYAMCCHNVLVTTEGDAAPPTVIAEPFGRTTIGLTDILVANFVPSCSIVARNRLFDRFPEWFLDIAGCDWVFNLLNARWGPVGYLKEPMAVYRKHPGSCWSSRPPREQLEAILKIYDRLPSILGSEYALVVHQAHYWTNSALYAHKLEETYARLIASYRLLRWFGNRNLLRLVRRFARPVMRLLRHAHFSRLLSKLS